MCICWEYYATVNMQQLTLTFATENTCYIIKTQVMCVYLREFVQHHLFSGPHCVFYT